MTLSLSLSLDFFLILRLTMMLCSVLANDGKTYLADGVNSLPDAKCTTACSVDSLVMQGRTTVVEN